MKHLAKLSQGLHQVAAGVADLLVSTRYARPMCSVTVHDALEEIQVHVSQALFELDQLGHAARDVVAPPRAG